MKEIWNKMDDDICDFYYQFLMTTKTNYLNQIYQIYGREIGNALTIFLLYL